MYEYIAYQLLKIMADEKGNKYTAIALECYSAVVKQLRRRPLLLQDLARLQENVFTVLIDGMPPCPNLEAYADRETV